MRKYLPLLLLAFSVPALAHPGHGTDSFQAGFLHPLTGLDHLLMLTGAGVLSALSGRKLLLPLATLGMMLAGAIAGSLLGGFSGMEMLIIASLAVCGVMMFKTENRLLLAVPALAMSTAGRTGWRCPATASGCSPVGLCSPAPRCCAPALPQGGCCAVTTACVKPSAAG